jgi:hypothetical protein
MKSNSRILGIAFVFGLALSACGLDGDLPADEPGTTPDISVPSTAIEPGARTITLDRDGKLACIDRCHTTVVQCLADCNSSFDSTRCECSCWKQIAQCQTGCGRPARLIKCSE